MVGCTKCETRATAADAYFSDKIGHLPAWAHDRVGPQEYRTSDQRRKGEGRRGYKRSARYVAYRFLGRSATNPSSLCSLSQSALLRLVVMYGSMDADPFMRGRHFASEIDDIGAATTAAEAEVAPSFEGSAPLQSQPQPPGPNQLTLSFQGQVYIFDSVQPERVRSLEIVAID
ncbi:hypothetical protein BHM03_00009736 [Ensete ventricosum]|nr:hypothetical protein BHM03_00009736 [Ensete ventricosum]